MVILKGKDKCQYDPKLCGVYLTVAYIGRRPAHVLVRAGLVILLNEFGRFFSYKLVFRVELNINLY